MIMINFIKKYTKINNLPILEVVLYYLLIKVMLLEAVLFYVYVDKIKKNYHFLLTKFI